MLEFVGDARDKRIAEQGVQLLQHGKSFAVTGPSGTGKSTLVEHLLASLDGNYYLGLHIHYGGLQRQALLKAVGDQLGVAAVFQVFRQQGGDAFLDVVHWHLWYLNRRTGI